MARMHISSTGRHQESSCAVPLRRMDRATLKAQSPGGLEGKADLVHAEMRLPGLHPCQRPSRLPLLPLHETVLGPPAPLCWSLCSLASQPFGPAPLACTIMQPCLLNA